MEADKYAPGDQVRVDTRAGPSFYGHYVKWRPGILWEHVVKMVIFIDGQEEGLRLGEEVPCSDQEVQACRFVAKVPTSIEGIEKWLNS